MLRDRYFGSALSARLQVRHPRRAVREHLHRRHAHQLRRAAGPDGGGHLAVGYGLHVLATFGWKAALAVMVNAAVLARGSSGSELRAKEPGASDAASRMPVTVAGIHLVFLVGVVLFAHHPVVFMGLFLFFLGYTEA